MKIVDCPWELANLDCRVAEISVTANEGLDLAALKEIEQRYDYVVVKVESGSMKNQIVLSKCGYALAETQLSMRKAKRYMDGESDEFVKGFLNDLSSERIKDEVALNELLTKITSGMFSTDRIYLDASFGPEYSLRRYRNWLRTEWQRRGIVHIHKYAGNYIGFSLCKQVENELRCLLVGVFEEFQKKRLGFMVPLVPEIIGQFDYKWYTAKISSNNMPVYRMYQWRNFEITNFEYVFIKHIAH